jgi:hypothetical protein
MNNNDLAVEAVIQVIRNLAAQGDVPADLATLPLTATTTIGALGLDSLARLILLEDLSEGAAGYLADDELTHDTTLAALAARLATLTPNS